MDKRTGLFYVAFGSISYGILATVVKYGYQHDASAEILTFSQYFFAVILLTLFAWFVKKSNKVEIELKYPSKKLKFKMVAYGTTLGFTSCFYYLAVQYVPVSVSIILLMQAIWMGVVIEIITTKNKNNSLKIIGAIVTIIGTLLAAKVFESSLTLHPLGVLYGLLAAFSFTFFMFFSNRLGHKTNVIVKSKYLVYGGFIVVLLFWNIDIINSFDLVNMFQYGLFLAVFGSMIPPIFFAQGMPAIGTGLGSIVSSIEIPFSVLSAAIILGEEVSIYQWMGILIILGAVVLINIRKV